MKKKLVKMLEIIREIAHNDKIGYSQAANHRWTDSRDCSSLIIQAAEDAGFEVKTHGATYTGNMKDVFSKIGWNVLLYQKGMILNPYDILLNELHHTAIVDHIGDNDKPFLIMACIDENGHTTGGQIGDQTGREIGEFPFYEPSYGWQYVLRPSPPMFDENYPGYGSDGIFDDFKKLPWLKYGDKSDLVKLLQVILNGYDQEYDLEIDGIFGTRTLASLKHFQMMEIIETDGIVGPETWQHLIVSR